MHNPYWHHHDCPGDGATIQPMQVLFTDDLRPIPRPRGHDGATMGIAPYARLKAYDVYPIDRALTRWWLLLIAQTCDCAWQLE